MGPSGPVDEAVGRRVAFELESFRRTAIDPMSNRNLNQVTSIDKSGEDALSMMVHDGATFVASGAYRKHLLNQLQARRQIKNISIDRTAELSPARAYAKRQCWRKPSNGS
jgi:hypothetical protein